MGLGDEMYAECLADGQSARVVPVLLERQDLRAELRRGARSDGVRVRTADLDGVVVIARLDAAVWRDDAATMRAKFTPRSRLPGRRRCQAGRRGQPRRSAPPPAPTRTAPDSTGQRPGSRRPQPLGRCPPAG